MDSEIAIDILSRQHSLIPEISKLSQKVADPKFKKWRRDTRVAICKIFGEESFHIIEYDKTRFVSKFGEDLGVYAQGINTVTALLESMIDEVKNYGLDESNSTNIPDALSLVEILCLRFHRFARQVQERYDNRPTIDIDDEYDLQDVFHALLRLHFDDVRKEEYSPSYASASSRIDFILKNEQIVIELKKTRPTLKAKEVGEQLIVDIARYAEHPDCKCLVCFVYDPENKIPNPDGLERDLERLTDRFKVRVIIAPKN